MKLTVLEKGNAALGKAWTLHARKKPTHRWRKKPVFILPFTGQKLES